MIIGGLVVLALSLVLVAPFFVDWSSYRSDFERQASAILGRKVSVEGEARARLLPFPSVTFTNVQVAGRQGAPVMTIDRFSMDAELAPFLRGEVLIFDMRLERPLAVIDIAEDGTVDWTIRPSSPFQPNQVALEKLTVTDGQVTIRHAPSGRTHTLSSIAAELSARTLAGPWRVEGSALIDAVSTSFSIGTGTAEGGKMRLRVRASPSNSGFTVETDGEASIGQEGVGYAGSFRLSGGGAQAGGKGDRDPRQQPEPASYRLGGIFSLTSGLLEIPEFRLETGAAEDPYTAEGAARIDLGKQPRFFVHADGAQIRFDETMPESGGGMALAERLAAAKRFVSLLPQPTMPGTVALNLPAIVAGDTTIRSIALSAEPAGDGWTVHTLRALLPGRTTLEVEGFLTTGEAFDFDGSLLLAIAQPSGFAAWVAHEVDDAIRRLPGAGFSAKVKLSEERQVFRDLELVLGQARFEGEAEMERIGEARAIMRLQLAGGEIDLDGLSALAAVFVTDEGINRFAHHDLDFKIAAGPVHVGGLTAQSVDAAMRLKQGRLDVDRLAIVGLAGAAVSATGHIDGFPSDPRGSIDASLVAVELDPLVAALVEQFPGNRALRHLHERAQVFPAFLSDASLDLVATVADDDDGRTGLAVSGYGAAGGTSFNMTATAKGEPDAPEQAAVTLSFNASNEDATALMALYGLPALPLGATGPAETSLALQGSLAGGLTGEVAFEGVDLNLAVEGRLQRAKEGLSLAGRGRIRADDLEPWLMTAGISFPGMGFGLPVDLEAKIAAGGSALSLSQVDGEFAGMATHADLEADLTDGVPHVTGQVNLQAFDIAVAAATVLGETALQPGTRPWPDLPFAAAARPAVTADLDVQAGSLLFSDLAQADDARLRMRLDEEGLRVADLEATLFGGRMTGLFELTNNDGSGLFSGQMQLDSVDLEQVVGIGNLSGRGDITATVSTSGKSVKAMMAALSGSGSVRLEQLVVPGINPDALGPILALADQMEGEAEALNAAGFVSQIATDGIFEPAPTEFAYTIAGGVLRVPPLRLEGLQAALSAEIRGDFSVLTQKTNGRFVFAAGEEALVGSEPAIDFSVEGLSPALEVELDFQPLKRFLTQRALEREQLRVEAMQADLMEKQRLRREARYYAALDDARRRLEAERMRARQEAERRARALERLRAEEERLQAEEKERLRSQEAADRQAEEALDGRADEWGARTLGPEGSSVQSRERTAAPPPTSRELPGVQDPFEEMRVREQLRRLQ